MYDCGEALEGFVTVGVSDGSSDTTVSSTSMGVCKESGLLVTSHIRVESCGLTAYHRLINRRAQDWVAQEVPVGSMPVGLM